MAIRPLELRPTPSPTPAPRAPAPSRIEPPSAPAEKSTFARILEGIGEEAARGEAMTRSAIRATQAGRDLGPTELLALQAGVYRYSEVVDLAAKLVDRASTGVKTIISGQ